MGVIVPLSTVVYQITAQVHVSNTQSKQEYLRANILDLNKKKQLL